MSFSKHSFLSSYWDLASEVPCGSTWPYKTCDQDFGLQYLLHSVRKHHLQDSASLIRWGGPVSRVLANKTTQPFNRNKPVLSWISTVWEFFVITVYPESSWLTQTFCCSHLLNNGSSITNGPSIQQWSHNCNELKSSTSQPSWHCVTHHLHVCGDRDSGVQYTWW